MKQLLAIIGIVFSTTISSQTTHRITVAVNQPVDCTLGLHTESAILYPNPSNDFVILKIPIGSINLFDTSGKKINVPYDVADQKVDVSALKNGLYFLEVIDSGKKEIFKINIKNQ